MCGSRLISTARSALFASISHFRMPRHQPPAQRPPDTTWSLRNCLNEPNRTAPSEGSSSSNDHTPFVQRLRSLIAALRSAGRVTNGWSSSVGTARSPAGTIMNIKVDAKWWMNATQIWSASPGTWTATRTCPSPRLWIVLTGHLRSFNRTQHLFYRAAQESAPDCFMFILFVPKRVNPLGTYDCWVEDAYRNDVTGLLRRAQSDVFGGRLAFAVATGMETFLSQPRMSPAFWCGSYLLALATAAHFSVPIDGASVVLLGRADKAYNSGLHLRGLQAYFRDGEHGRHMILGQEDGAGVLQGDHHMITSFGAFHSDIGLPLALGAAAEEACTLHAEVNRLGYGQSMLGLGAHSRLASSCQSRCSDACRCLDGQATCEWPSCYAVIGQSKTSSRFSLLREYEAPPPYKDGNLSNLAASVRLYCPSDGGPPSCAHKQINNSFWLPQDSFYKCWSGVRLLPGTSWPCRVASDAACRSSMASHGVGTATLDAATVLRDLRKSVRQAS